MKYTLLIGTILLSVVTTTQSMNDDKKNNESQKPENILTRTHRSLTVPRPKNLAVHIPRFEQPVETLKKSAADSPNKKPSPSTDKVLKLQEIPRRISNPTIDKETLSRIKKEQK